MKKWLSILKIVGPPAAAFIPGVGPLLVPIIITAIAEAEKLHGASGAQKKVHALELVKAGAAGVTAASGGKVTIDPQQAATAADHAIDAVVGVTNLVRAATPDAPVSADGL